MKNKVVKATSAQDKIFTEIVSGEKIFYADEPLSIGGTDLAPNPFDYFLASLASCTTITIQMYAKRKGWNIGQVSVTVQLDTSEAQTNKINKTISFEKDLTLEQRERLLFIAEKCPISKLMRESLSINS